MTDAVQLKPDLGRFGVWTVRDRRHPSRPSRSRSWATARCGSAARLRRDLNVRRADPRADRDAAGGHRHRQRLDGAGRARSPRPTTASRTPIPGRFLLGIGIGHPEHTEEYRKPYDVLVEYLDALDAAKVPTSRRVIAALGPKVLKLSRAPQRRRAPVPDHAGAHRPGPRTGRQHGVSGARAQGGADHRRRRGPRDRPQDRRLLSEPVQLPEQLEAAGLHRRRRRQARQRPADRRGGRATARPTTSPRG